MMKTGLERVLSLLCLALLASGCADTHTPAFGGETHFLSCERDSDCEVLGGGFVCGAGGTCESDGASIASADECTGDECVPAPSADGEAAIDSAGAGAAPCTGDDCPVTTAQPLVMLVVDSSGSMERLPDCQCATPGCEECLPRCGAAPGSQRNRWAVMLEALTGRFDGFTCATLPRTADNGMTYDAGYYLPYNRPEGDQQDDGALDTFAEELRFGVATFDAWDTYVGAPPLVAALEFDLGTSRGRDGMWSYDPAEVLARAGRLDPEQHGMFFYPNCAEPYFMDTGIRSAIAEEGALRVAHDPGEAMAVNQAIQRDLLTVRPYGGTPIAASFEDLDTYLRDDPDSAHEREEMDTPRHVVLLTDGYPDDDYRQFGCNCREDQEPDDPNFCGGPSNDPNMMQCPYRTPEDAARVLRCGRGATCDDGIVDRVHVVGLAVSDPIVVDRLDAIARAGGSEEARLAGDTAGLREALTQVFGEIAAER